MNNTPGILTRFSKLQWRMKKYTPRGLNSQSLSGQIRDVDKNKNTEKKHRTVPKPTLGPTTAALVISVVVVTKGRFVS